MIDLQFLQQCEFFEKKNLKIEELLFDEWATDENLYIIYEWELFVEKKEKYWEWYKILSIVRTWNILWEWGLIQNHKKEVRIRASRNSILLAIPGVKFIDFVTTYPSESYQLLIHIIAHTNDRLLKANSEITANYEVGRVISKLKDFDRESIEEVLRTIQIILDSESIIYFEKNTVMPWYYKLRYYSWVINIHVDNSIIYLWEDGFDIPTVKNTTSDIIKKFAIAARLMYGWELKWYILVCRDTKKYTENEHKLLENSTISFAWVIGHKDILDIERNKKHIKSI